MIYIYDILNRIFSGDKEDEIEEISAEFYTGDQSEADIKIESVGFDSGQDLPLPKTESSEVIQNQSSSISVEVSTRNLFREKRLRKEI